MRRQKPLLDPSLSYLAAIADASDDAIVGVSLDGAILSWNPGAERIFGYSAREIVGQPVSLLWPPDRLNQASGFFERTARGETILNHETERVGKGGQRFQLSLSIFPSGTRTAISRAPSPWPATSPRASRRKKPCA